jgi:hypothetical protein
LPTILDDKKNKEATLYGLSGYKLSSIGGLLISTGGLNYDSNLLSWQGQVAVNN